MLAATLMPLLTGCASGLPAGQSGVKVVARAEPKTGYTLDVQAADVYVANPVRDDATTARQDPFRPLDYRNLEDIVVYLMPVNASAAAAPIPPPKVIDAGGGATNTHEWHVSSIGADLQIGNSSDQPRNVYIRSDAGKIIDVGTIAPGKPVFATLTVPGSLAVFAETGGAEDQRIAEVYVAPNGWFGKTVSGGRVTIAPVPPGTYVLHTWHWRLPGTEQTIELRPDKYTEVTAKVTVNVLPPPK